MRNMIDGTIAAPLVAISAGKDRIAVAVVTNRAATGKLQEVNIAGTLALDFADEP